MFLGFRLSSISSFSSSPPATALCWSTDDLVWGATNYLTWG